MNSPFVSHDGEKHRRKLQFKSEDPPPRIFWNFGGAVNDARMTLRSSPAFVVTKRPATTGGISDSAGFEAFYEKYPDGCGTRKALEDHELRTRLILRDIYRCVTLAELRKLIDFTAVNDRRDYSIFQRILRGVRFERK